MWPESGLHKAVLMKRILRSNFGRPGFPYKLTFAVTYRCNLRCKTCLIWSKEPKPEMDIGEIERFFKKSNDFSWIDLTGGEIFLREDLDGIIDAVLSNCRSLCILHFPTNGQLKDKVLRTAEKIRSAKRVVPIITVSIDGPEDIHNEIRGAAGAWRKAVETFAGLKKMGIGHVYIGYTISRHNTGQIEKTFSAIKDIYTALSLDDLHVNFFHSSRHYFNNTSLNDECTHSIAAEYGRLEKKRGKKRVKDILEKKYMEKIPRYLETGGMPVRCQALRSTLFLDPYGDIYACSIYDRKVANIRGIDYDLKKLWNSAGEIDDIREEIRDKRCGGCWTPCEAYPSLLGSLLHLSS